MESKTNWSLALLPEGRISDDKLHAISCRDCPQNGPARRVMHGDLVDFVTRVLAKLGVSEADARVTGNVLAIADVRGIPSHGVARLSRYIKGIEDGYIKPNAGYEMINDAPIVARIDARSNLGQVVAEQAMDMTIEKAKNYGIGMATVSNSNHFGIAGYYVLKALQADLLGICMTNSAPLVVPTYGAEAFLGTNPIAFGAPTRVYPPFILDMATSVVPRGKIEVYDRKEKDMPFGWAVDEKGQDCHSPVQVLKNLLQRLGGGILPLGGRGEEFGGHKGYGLSFMVDVLTGVLSGAGYGPDVDDVHRSVKPGEQAVPDVGHCFMAVDVSKFMPLEVFTARMDNYIERVKSAVKAEGETDIYYPGEKSYARSLVHERDGIPLTETVLGSLTKIAQKFQIDPPLTVAQRSNMKGN